LPNYKCTKEDIDNFFASDNGQKEEHILEESICEPLIEQKNYKPFSSIVRYIPK